MKLPTNSIYNEHVNIIRNWIENIMTFNESTQKKRILL